MNLEEQLSLRQAANLMKVTKQRAWQLLQEGTLDGVMFDSFLIISKESVDRWVASKEAKKSPTVSIPKPTLEEDFNNYFTETYGTVK